MGYFTSETKAVADGPNTITIRKLSWDEKQRVDMASMEFPSYDMVMAKGQKPAVVQQGAITMDPNRGPRMLLQLGIVAWAGPDFLDDAGDPVPCTDENKLRLPPALGDRLFEEIKDFSELSSAEKNA